MINHKKAYLLGLLLGGGKISDETFIIELPFEKWGMNPANMNKIAIDILTQICNNFVETYNFSVTYEIGNKRWLRKPINIINTQLIKDDLSVLGLPTSGILLNTADLTVAKEKLSGISVESFLSGIFDTRASLSLSHRRFVDQAPIVSLEIPGSTKNFKFVVQICSWLTTLGSVTDQILYNHPCQHSAADPTYAGWKKGFKIRFLVKSFITNHSFAMKAKTFDANHIEKSQIAAEQTPCFSRIIRKPSAVSIHNDINSSALPLEVRNKLFFHYHHFCAVLGCPFAPVEQVENIVADYQKYISVFPRLLKGKTIEIYIQYKALADKNFSDSELETVTYKVKDLMQNKEFHHYKELEIGLAYLLSTNLNGKRHIGSQADIINSNQYSMISIIRPKSIPETPIYLENAANKRAVIISLVDCKFNRQIIEKLIKTTNLEVIIK